MDWEQFDLFVASLISLLHHLLFHFWEKKERKAFGIKFRSIFSLYAQQSSLTQTQIDRRRVFNCEELLFRKSLKLLMQATVNPTFYATDEI